MKLQFEILHQTRQHFLKLLEGLSLDQLNEVPKGYPNNLVWNLGHAVASQQRLTYGLSGLPFAIDEALVNRYARGTKPDGHAHQEDVDLLKELATSTLVQLESDYATGIFVNFKPYLTGYGVHLETIKDALSFLPVHEGLHMGYSMALKRAVMNSF